MNITLGPITDEDLPQLIVWRNALMELGYVRQWKYISAVDQSLWYDKIHDPLNEHVMLAVLDGDKIIGVVGLCYIDWVRKKAEASIYIGDKAMRGKGAGKAALESLLDYGFGKLGMHRIWAEIFKHNEISDKLFASVGFVNEGTMRHSHFHDGKWIDSTICSMLFDEWNKRRGPVPSKTSLTLHD